MNHNFNEKKTEYSSKQKTEIPVWVSDKYKQSKQKAIEIIEKYDDIHDSDFWILMNETKTKKMAYTGLIITHNGCLKIHDHLDQKFKPSCVSVDKDGYRGSLVYTYCDDELGIYEVGEVSPDNCRNGYPYAMAFKRLFDRVILKLSKLAYSGIYSDSEADEFKEPLDEEREEKGRFITEEQIAEIEKRCKDDAVPVDFIVEAYNVSELSDLRWAKAQAVLSSWDTVKNSYNKRSANV